MVTEVLKSAGQLDVKDMVGTWVVGRVFVSFVVLKVWQFCNGFFGWLLGFNPSIIHAMMIMGT
jgi:hypothetical protein